MASSWGLTDVAEAAAVAAASPAVLDLCCEHAGCLKPLGTVRDVGPWTWESGDTTLTATIDLRRSDPDTHLKLRVHPRLHEGLITDFLALSH